MSVFEGMNRRQFIAGLSAAATLALTPACLAADKNKKLFEISLAQWSLHRMIRAKKLDNLDFAKFTKETFDIHAVEYVNQFFKDKAKDKKYLAELKARSTGIGVTNVLIMCDGEGHMGDNDEKKRIQTVENHKKWVEAAKFLGCHSIRVNAYAKGSYEEQIKLAADGLSRLSTFAKDFDINVIVENHGGNSSNGKWLKTVMETVNMPNCGTLPDFGNFHGYDRYLGVTETMKFAKGVSAKSHEFNAEGYEVKTDYEKMIKIVLDAGYRGYIGVEYEGGKVGEVEGIKLTRDLLIKMRDKYSSMY
ncbi:MAG: sugar phosphate isomerase/epimerase [Lentisphaeraceae bacterium]|nr:sugar phosphate isomerase/epimerase [Lentisphaeraceae bacterium]